MTRNGMDTGVRLADDRRMTRRHVVLMGLMGSGKSSVGAAVAAALGWPHRDSDVDLRTATGRSARQIAAADGIDALHALELDHLLDALATSGPSVISAAASVIDDPGARDALEDPSVLVVWLRVSAATAARRMTSADHRPRPEAVQVQAARRDPWFASVADLVIDADSTADGRGRPVKDLVDEVLGSI